MLLVILVVFLFLRDLRATLIPCVAVPVSLISTFGVMYLFGYSLDNLSLMALTIATGFVVDDAIVVLENITRYREQGMPSLQAALRGAREITFTVLSMTLSLVAVFLPILFMGGMMGRLFREFAVTLSVAILVSLVVSLTTTPMMCARLLKSGSDRSARAVVPVQRAILRTHARRVCRQSGLGASTSAQHARGDARHDGIQHLSLRHHSERILSRSRIRGACSEISRPRKTSLLKPCARNSLKWSISSEAIRPLKT